MEEVKSEVALANKFFEDFNVLKKEISKVIIGQDEVVNLLLTSIFCQGHSLLVGVPGLAKTLLISTISSALDLKFNRIQFTPDLMPSDILGAETLDKDRNFKFIQGPIFANIILADEINRTPPKTQAALLEAMQEYAVTVAGQTFNIQLTYPSFASEIDIVKGTTTDEQKIVNKVLGAEEVLAYQHLVRRVPVADNVVEYAVNLVHKTRVDSERAPSITKEYVEWGAGPRASQNLIIAAKCNALLNNKYSPDIEDVKAVAKPILRHRIVRNFKAEAEGITIDKLIEELL